MYPQFLCIAVLGLGRAIAADPYRDPKFVSDDDLPDLDFRLGESQSALDLGFFFTPLSGVYSPRTATKGCKTKNMLGRQV